jgi:hypothetical protein
MQREWTSLKEELDAETKKIMTKEPVEVKRLFAGVLPYDAGVGGQYFTTLVFVWSVMQGLGFSFVSRGILQVLNDPDFTLEQCKKMFGYLHVLNNFLGYAGLEKLHDFTKKLTASFDTIETKEEMLELMISYFNYVHIMYGWIHAKFPWGLGSGIYRKKTPEEIKELAKLYAEGSKILRSSG